MTYRMLASLVCAVALSAPMLATAQGGRDAGAIAALKERQARAERQRANVASKLSAADRQELREQEQRVQRLIDRLESGRTVSPQEIDEAFGLSR